MGEISLTQRISYLFSTCWYFKSHRILSHGLIPFLLHPATDYIQDKVGVVSTSKTTGGENPTTKEPPMGKNPSTTREPIQTEERATLGHSDKEIKETTALNLIQLLPQKITLQRQLEKQNIRNHRKKTKQKESPKMGRQRKNLQSKGMEDSPLKELNEMEVSKLSDIEFQIMVIMMLKELKDNYKELSENYNTMKRK